MSKNILKNKPLTAIALGALITLILTAFSLTNAFTSWHLKIADILYTYDNPSEDIIIIAIDKKSTDALALGRFSQWSREKYVELLEKLGEDPKIIAFDLLFNTTTQQLPLEKIKFLKNSIDDSLSSREKLEIYETFIENNSLTIDNEIDNKFEQKLKEFNNIILAFSSNSGNPIFPLPKFSENATIGDSSVESDEDGILRKTQPY